MKYRAYIIDNATREGRWYETDVEDQYADSVVFSWQENNFACDCNRHLSFLRAGGPGPEDDPHHNNAERECGETAYTVPYIEWEDGRREEIDPVEPIEGECVDLTGRLLTGGERSDG